MLKSCVKRKEIEKKRTKLRLYSSQVILGSGTNTARMSKPIRRRKFRAAASPRAKGLFSFSRRYIGTKKGEQNISLSQ